MDSLSIPEVSFHSNLSSEVDSTSNLPSTANSYNTRGRSAHETWDHTRPTEPSEPTHDAKGVRLLYCKYCTTKSCYASAVTTNFRRHVSTKHNITIGASTSRMETQIVTQLENLMKDAKLSGRTAEINSHLLREYLDQRTIGDSLVSLVVLRNLSHRIVEWPEFHVLCRCLNPSASSVLPASHSHMGKLIGNSFFQAKDVVRRHLQSAISSLHLALDIWTSPNRHLFLGVVCHFVDINEKRQKALLALRIVGSHSGEDQCCVVLSILKEYGVTRQLGAVIGDNHGANDTLCRALSKTFLEEEGIEWNPTSQRLRCLGHILNLAAHAFLFQGVFSEKDLESYDNELATDIDEKKKEAKASRFRVMGPLGGLHNIVVYIRGSPSRTQEFVRLAGRMIPLDNSTRWNSWHSMISVAISLENELDIFCKSHFKDLEADYLSPQHWQRLRTIEKFLRYFEGDDATLDKVLHTMDILIQCFKDSKVSFLFVRYRYVVFINEFRLNIAKIQNSLRESRMLGVSLTSITSCQTFRLTMLLLSFFILIVVRRILKMHGQKSCKIRHWLERNSFGRGIVMSHGLVLQRTKHICLR